MFGIIPFRSLLPLYNMKLIRSQKTGKRFTKNHDMFSLLEVEVLFFERVSDAKELL
jgi:hypothetical protein